MKLAAGIITLVFGVLGGLAYLFAPLVLDNPANDHGQVAFGATGSVTLPAGKVTLYYVAESGFENVSVPRDLRMSVRRGSGETAGPELPLRRVGAKNSIQINDDHYVSFATMEAPAAGPYSVAVGPSASGEARAVSFGRGVGQELAGRWLPAALIALAGLLTGGWLIRSAVR